MAPGVEAGYFFGYDLPMQRSTEDIELVLQEVCVQHCSVETMRCDFVKMSPHRKNDSDLRLEQEERMTSEKSMLLKALDQR
ncbi:hypothetical protein AB6A40_006044 [Gnathostoma spinigerum]|uniref:Uncharacterized protein n=1 Tax=Gnathostoma spinigerum TaxID=75299 RepID=A0ABD6ESV6_9BILA